MIDPQELRIGNWLLYKGKPDKVTAIDLDLDDESVPLVSFSRGISSIELNYGHVEPILLTEDILKECGFDKEMCMDIGRGWSSFEKVIKLAYDYYVEESLETGIKYLHELQNLIYILTKEELQVDLK